MDRINKRRNHCQFEDNPFAVTLHWNLSFWGHETLLPFWHSPWRWQRMALKDLCRRTSAPSTNHKTPSDSPITLHHQVNHQLHVLSPSLWSLWSQVQRETMSRWGMIKCSNMVNACFSWQQHQVTVMRQKWQALPGCKESRVRQPRARGFCDRASEFCA